MHPVHTLEAGDRQRRIEFCNWLTEKLDQDEDFLNKIIWTDESRFTNCGLFNRHNEHYWAEENPRHIVQTRPQIKFGVNVWAGIVGGRVLGPYLYDVNLTGVRYNDFLGTTLMEYVEDIPLNEVQNMWWQQDGAPPHNSRVVSDTLNHLFGTKWIGTHSLVVRWPARSPDLSPLDYYLWGHLKNRIYQRVPASVEELRQNIVFEFNQLRRRDILRSVANLRRRIALCLQNNGAHFEQFL